MCEDCLMKVELPSRSHLMRKVKMQQMQAAKIHKGQEHNQEAEVAGKIRSDKAGK